MSHARNAIPTQVLFITALVLASAAVDRATAGPIKAGRLQGHVEILASDRFEGRETGERGVELAEDYIRDTFEAADLQPLPGQDDFFIGFELQNTGFDGRNSTLLVWNQDREWEAERVEDYRPFPFSASQRVEGQLVFAGYGITAPEHGWDDYADLDVEGKIVVVLRYEPGKDDPNSPFNGRDNSSHAYFATKERVAREHGAIGMLVVQGPLHRNEPRNFTFPRGLSLRTEDDERPHIAAAQVRRSWLRRALRKSEFDLRDLQEDLEDGVRPADMPPLDLSVTLEFPRLYDETTPARNVVAFVPGSDPQLRHEWIVIGAHHDHVGVGSAGNDRIFNGADDNASGTAVLLELARAWRRLDPAPARSVVFATFTAEEKGLLGSRALVQSGDLPLDQVRFMINLDMVGRNGNRPVQVFADPRARGLRNIVERANRGIDLSMQFENESLPGNSDHSSFRVEDIPVMFFFTGTHNDYHRPGDHADKLDYERMQDIGSLTFELLRDLADARGDDFPNPTHDVFWLGAELKIEGSPEGVQGVLSAVQPQSPASVAGLQVGDIIAAIGKEVMKGNRRVGSRIQEVEPEKPVELTLQRNGTSAVVEVVRPQPGFLGIAYAALTAEDCKRYGLAQGHGVRVQQVLPDGPADAAGLREGDIIVRVADQPARHSDLAPRVQAVGARNTVEMQILRNGETLERSVKLAELPPAG